MAGLGYRIHNLLARYKGDYKRRGVRGDCSIGTQLLLFGKEAGTDLIAQMAEDTEALRSGREEYHYETTW